MPNENLNLPKDFVMVFVFLYRDSDGHIAPESEEEPKLPGAVCEAAGFLPRIGRGQCHSTGYSVGRKAALLYVLWNED